MRRRTFTRLGWLWLQALTLGCATKADEAGKPASVAQATSAPDSRIPGHVALWIRPQVRATVTRVPYQPAEGLEVPVGLILEEAAVAALGLALQGGAIRVDALPSADEGHAATLVVEAVRLEHSMSMVLGLLSLPPFLVPVPLMRSHLAFELSLQDPQGRVVWTHTYDGGREAVIQKSVSKWQTETLAVSLVRTAQDSARSLSGKMVADLREWLAAERNKPRDL